jgi:hypothetical protein
MGEDIRIVWIGTSWSVAKEECLELANNAAVINACVDI